MTTPIDKAVELARAATRGKWQDVQEKWTYPECSDADTPCTIRDESGVEIAHLAERYDLSMDGDHVQDAAFIAACNPAQILAWQAQWAEDRAQIAALQASVAELEGRFKPEAFYYSDANDTDLVIRDEPAKVHYVNVGEVGLIYAISDNALIGFKIEGDHRFCAPPTSGEGE